MIFFGYITFVTFGVELSRLQLIIIFKYENFLHPFISNILFLKICFFCKEAFFVYCIIFSIICQVICSRQLNHVFKNYFFLHQINKTKFLKIKFFCLLIIKYKFLKIRFFCYVKLNQKIKEKREHFCPLKHYIFICYYRLYFSFIASIMIALVSSSAQLFQLSSKASISYISQITSSPTM